ncbi:hypothetical protein SARC_05599 [Sphaeroforma arctica JP610]|uniref:Small ribosomal subunit protein mS29 n=1 Tax=Sphaeroforma arctica JP610 TaxID=667725 RepID=A0A0L0FZ70_9EUKA|nr:hypothetical protein SARC_05599 [Sphaeroforma arctica JP610]KNC82110.1 hypothetical protein SARC_05599 [Sphaeroforma arctica JP610]|eukprot:XP_014156012.1 hypothetical protein SARC_05599 [Sphaeroforma arctica JP610]
MNSSAARPVLSVRARIFQRTSTATQIQTRVRACHYSDTPNKGGGGSRLEELKRRLEAQRNAAQNSRPAGRSNKPATSGPRPPPRASPAPPTAGEQRKAAPFFRSSEPQSGQPPPPKSYFQSQKPAFGSANGNASQNSAQGNRPDGMFGSANQNASNKSSQSNRPSGGAFGNIANQKPAFGSAKQNASINSSQSNRPTPNQRPNAFTNQNARVQATTPESTTPFNQKPLFGRLNTAPNSQSGGSDVSSLFLNRNSAATPASQLRYTPNANRGTGVFGGKDRLAQPAAVAPEEEAAQHKGGHNHDAPGGVVPASNEPIEIGNVPLTTPLAFKYHSAGQIGQFYEWSSEDDEKRGKKAKEDVVWPKGMKDQFKLFGKNSLMIRQPALEVLAHIRNHERTENRDKKFGVLVNGMRGTGKSATIAHVAQTLADKGHVVLHIPKATFWMYEADRVVKSAVHPWFDQPFDATDLIDYFLKINDHAMLKDIKLKHKYEIEGAAAGPGTPRDSILDLARMGAGPLDLEILEDYPPAREVLPALMEELRLMTDKPVLVAVDDFNAFYNVSELRDNRNRRLHGLHMAITQLVIRLLDDKYKLARGTLLMGLTNTGIKTNTKFSTEIKGMIKEAAAIDPFNSNTIKELPELVKVQTRAFTEKEVERFLLYHHSCNKRPDTKDLRETTIAEVRMMSSCIPEQVSKLSVYM